MSRTHRSVDMGSRFCYHLIIVFAFCLTVTVIAFSYGKIETIWKNTSSLLYSSSENVEKSKLDEAGTSSKLSDLKFYSSYHVKGFLRLPSSNLNEPLEVWYNKENNQSRIDYYGGDVKTYQDGTHSLYVKIVPKYDSVKMAHTIGCWMKHKGHGGGINPQNILPTAWSWPFKTTLDQFKHIGDENIEGRMCTKWRYEHQILGRNNSYTYWIAKRNPPAPVRYEMLGYDTLLTSYYDKYIIDYTSYEKWKYDKAIFEIPQVPGCLNVSDHHGDEGEDFINPISEFTSAHHNDGPIERAYHKYKNTHGKTYNDTENSKRKLLFRHNARFISSMNRRNLTYKLKHNSFADMTEAEYNLHKGSLPDHSMQLRREKRKIKYYINEKYKPFRKAPKIPETLDWRDYGAVFPPRGQGTCGCCWAFAAIGAIESANFIKTGKLVKLSEQQMVDCTWKVKGTRENNGNNGCHGGMAWKVMFWGKSNTIATSESYGPYRGQEGHCKTDNITAGAEIYGFRRVKKGSAEGLRRAIAYHGPAAVAIDSHPLTLKFYSNGVLDETDCTNHTDHAVLVVGYGMEKGINYWLIKNSWSTLWGDKGYIKIKEDQCGILKKPVVVLNRHINSYPWHRKLRPRRKQKHGKHRRNRQKRKRKHR